MVAKYRWFSKKEKKKGWNIFTIRLKLWGLISFGREP